MVEEDAMRRGEISCLETARLVLLALVDYIICAESG